MNKELIKFVENKLCDNQLLEAISGRLKYQEKDLSYVSKYDEEYIKAIQDKCNERFMKCLNYLTLNEALKKEKQRLRIVDEK